MVVSDGLASDQSDYFWLAMTLAAQGDIVLTYDPAGQGASQGSVANVFAPSTPGCAIGGACRDLEDVVRWLLDDPITPIVDLARSTPLDPVTTDPTPPSQAAAAVASNPLLHNPDAAPAGSNAADPALGLIDPSRLAVAGHSMGALSMLNYVRFQSQGEVGADGQPLPPIAAGISLAGAAPSAATVPIQFQTSDFDGSPTLVGPAVGGLDLAFSDSGIGYQVIKPLYDQLRTTGPGTSALSLLVFEGGVHTDFIDTPFITRTQWSLALSAALRDGVAGLLPPARLFVVPDRGDAVGPPLFVVRQRGHARGWHAPPRQPLHHRSDDAVTGGDAARARGRAGGTP